MKKFWFLNLPAGALHKFYDILCIVLHKYIALFYKNKYSFYLCYLQDNWGNGETGRSTHDIVPMVSNKPVGWNREEIMFVTGHGPFPSYLHRFNLRKHDNCLCEKREIQFTMPQNVGLLSPGISKLQ
ncbi:hypothetical protein AVEN_184377-1 [Araneus ventricosus]|uniref:Uncharacterized protein n=1 Tax=Araneus ventricosus TaxID=182803 RepID=A0A4Y2BGV9_ARAVE|nr:hypothetical protein AVEN_184377-1 [Araneus ventricosus]